ncbi:iron hydrogenase [Metschnikowia bicuspidata]|uniref:Cytosolic Fe-S cluster assembly factor NAR1 n=1 Tax=Metschnikowia bicuspidata TaxID=27322 RepID=A0A4P9ZI12_9ASCO|nr:iron hydrogenase [Metschnikowia bicuspidata]
MSALLSADDLNDFIKPGAACIKPLEQPAVQTAGEVEIQIDENGQPLEISKIDGKISALVPAQISLSDCLACSGCITSAEEVLVAQHSHEQFLRTLRYASKTFVVSISHQSRVSLAHAYGCSLSHMDRLLIAFFKNQLGFAYVVGTALGRKLLLLEEALRMLRKKTAALSACTPHKPVLSSICPGWVLYAEKTHPHVLPYISQVKSTQQITGTLLKELTACELGCSRSDIYHLSIMPCFDKKLESARTEQDDLGSPDVDCVLTAKELVQLVNASEYELFPQKDSGEPTGETKQMSDLYASCAPQNWPFKDLLWSNDSGSESGGYGFSYIQAMKEHLLRTDPSYAAEKFAVVTVEGKNSDVYELRLTYDGQKLASAAVVNGFRNIQNLVRKLKPTAAPSTKANSLALRRRARVGVRVSASPLPVPEDPADSSKADYVEVMACPSGCINGGGQIARPQTTPEKEWLAEAKALYWQVSPVDVIGDTDLADRLTGWVTAFFKQSGISRTRLYDSHFNEVEKPTDPAAMTFGTKW